jgi:ribosomal protein S12 methylthiotransferase accessory factor
MRLEVTYLNGRIELFDGVFGEERQAELRALPRLYNHILGPVTSVSLHRPGLLDLSLYSAVAMHSPVGSLIRDLSVRAGTDDPLLIPGSGKGAGLQQPFLGALGEMAERLLAMLHSAAVVDDLTTATYDELTRAGHRALGPDDLPLFASEQYAQTGFGFVPFRPDSRLKWIEGTELLGHSPILVPAQLVLMYNHRRAAEERIGYPTSGGLAFHSDRRQSILRGIHECIERDAINVRWHCRLPPPSVAVDLAAFLAEDLGIRTARLSTPHVDGVDVYVNTLDVPIPIFSAIAINRSRRERTFMSGCGAASGKGQALAQALFELGQSQAVLNLGQLAGMRNIEASTAPSQMTDFSDATLYYGYAENRPRLAWFTAGQREIPWAAVPTATYQGLGEEYDSTTDLLRALGLRPIVVDLGGDWSPAGFVTKVLLPQLTQAGVPSHPYLGHPRFYELARRLGAAGRPLEYADLNPDPVPFS